MSLATLLLIFLGPWLVILPFVMVAEMSAPGLLLGLCRPAGGPAPRPVTRPRPARLAVA